ncbi:ArsR family transcriptional regulator [Spongiactinospora gelatinilytica]|uniref:ArsR family transcriptional regulator n=1 Tax=Spongiactinospora gelatinilytica TaxID=2666298 RepID=A0A2W2IEW0_9ACTN|nr:metalloregulator ArsR/SmtB family transcription factor [Spongiactinospora gelatinilytica]PZG56657.1 ArsR family transcriptional regulator [Spongiactinospora gelatinilytica]
MVRELDVRLLEGEELSNQERARRLVPKLRALADENRAVLALLIAERPRTVRELQDATGMSQTLVSHHLRPLREQGLVKVIPRGRSNVYTLCCEELGTPVRWLASLAALTPEGAQACCLSDLDDEKRESMDDVG